MATCRRRRARRAWVGQRGGATSGVVRQLWGTEPGLAAPAEGGACDAACGAPAAGPHAHSLGPCVDACAWACQKGRGCLIDIYLSIYLSGCLLSLWSFLFRLAPYPRRGQNCGHARHPSVPRLARSVARPQHRARSAFAFARPRHCPVLYAAHGGRACSPSPRHRFLPPLVFYAERSKAVAERAGADGASWVGAVGLSVVGVCLLVSSVFRTVFTTVPLGSALPLRRLAEVLGFTLLMWAAVFGTPILVLGLWRLGLWRPWTSAPVQRCVQERKTAHHNGFLRPLPPRPPSRTTPHTRHCTSLILHRSDDRMSLPG